MGKKNKKGKKTVVKERSNKPENPKKEVKVNPFELRINHQRYNILGRKSKNDKGMPGVSRNKAIKKRKEFMFKNKLITSKSNCFIDKRIGEYDKSILKEDQIAARLVYERSKKLKRNIYNLNDDEELTHLGKPLSMLEAVDNPISDSDDDDKLDANFVEEVHFGGFLTKKSNNEPVKTHKEIIDEMILESKRKKAEKKLEREKNMDLTDKLDKEWKELMLSLGGLKHENKPAAPQNDPYDRIVKELMFEPRGTPANKLKMPEEIEKEEREKLEKLENERLLRMKDLTVDQKVSDQLMSADSIYDGLELEDDFLMPTGDSSADVFQEVEEQNESGNNGVRDSGHTDSECSSQNDDDDMYSDLNSESENEEEMGDKNESSFKAAVVGVSTKNPSKFVCAETLEQLLEITACSTDEVSVVVERMVKCNHPSLGDGNRSKMESLFKTLLDYIVHICKERGEFAEVVNSLVPCLYSLAQMSPLNCALTFQEILLEQYGILKKQKRSAVFKKNFPHISALVILKLCGILYSTSDFRHPVVIIAMLYMSEVLSHKFFISYENIITRLFITNLFYEYVSLSKRFIPEAVNTLQTILFCSSVKCPELFKYRGSACRGDQDLLLVTSKEKCEPRKISITMLSALPIQGSGELKISLLDNAVKQLHHYVDMYSSLPSFPEVFLSIHKLLESLPIQYFPESLKNSVTKLNEEILGVMAHKRSYLVFPLKRPKPLKLFEPEFDLNFGYKTNNLSKKIKLAKDISKQCKREEKGIVREMRRDAQFLARQQLEEKMEKDEERRNKVKKLFHDLAVQQGEIKAMNKKRK